MTTAASSSQCCSHVEAAPGIVSVSCWSSAVLTLYKYHLAFSQVWLLRTNFPIIHSFSQLFLPFPSPFIPPLWASSCPSVLAARCPKVVCFSSYGKCGAWWLEVEGNTSQSWAVVPCTSAEMSLISATCTVLVLHTHTFLCVSLIMLCHCPLSRLFMSLFP